MVETVADTFTVLIPMAIFGFVLGCPMISIKVPGRGIGVGYMGTPTVNDDSR